MATICLIIGRSGAGKSTSLRNFTSEEITVINPTSKPLPFRNNWKYVIKTNSYEKIEAALKKSPCNVIVIDDANYLMTETFMSRHQQSKGNAQFTLYNDIADQFYNLIKTAQSLPDNKIIYFIMHEEQSENTMAIKPKTIGKLLDDKVCIEGLFTIVLRAMCINKKYVFRTQTDGMDVAKSPVGMFKDFEIDNDLKAVDTVIREYWGLVDNETETVPNETN